MPTGDGSTITKRIRNLLRSPSVKHSNHKKRCLTAKVTLEKVLGITAAGNSGLACDPHSGLVAYPAGCVVVLLNPKKNRQQHLINTSRKTITALAFSPDGKYLVTGESGHLPAVRLWDVSERRQVAELQKHNYGVACVAFSPNSKYIVSVGTQHDMTINVWAWKKDVLVAVNKVSSKVTAVSFSEDSSYFVTAGIRHIKFWYLDPCKPTKASCAVPLLGRSGLLGELKNNAFCDVACGRGSRSGSTFCVTSSGLLCEFNPRRTLDKWVDLRTGAVQSLSLSDDIIFCGGADGTVRCFSPADLRFLGTLPRPHPLGVDVCGITRASNLLPKAAATTAHYPDAVAVTYDPTSRWLSCVYSDHSVYVWDVHDVRRVGKVHSALFHAASVWDLQMLPDAPPEESGGGPAPSVFFSCSSDGTIRQWSAEGLGGRAAPDRRHILSSDLMSVIYTDEGASAASAAGALLEAGGTEKPGDGPAVESSRAGLRSICVSPDGKHLASGGRNGMLRVHELRSMKEILKVDAHDAEILCLEYSKPETGVALLASASRDRLIHVFDAGNDYSLQQTLDEHSSSITAVRFAANNNNVRLISCGADKSIYFRTAHTTDAGPEFRRSHHVVGKTTLYDLGVDPTCRYTAVGCQDRGIRIFNINSGKQKKLYKGSVSEDGSLLKVQMDPSGLYLATSCSDKNISIFDFHTGECVANMFGHSEVVTGMKFTNDCRHLVSVSGDSCIFVWRLSAELTVKMRERLCQLRVTQGDSPSTMGEGRSAPGQVGLSSDSDREHEEDEPEAERDLADDRGYHDEDSLSNTSTTTDNTSSNGEEEAGVSQPVQAWDSPKVGSASPVTPDPARRPRRRWSRRMGSLELIVKSMLDLRQLDSFSSSRGPEPAPRTRGLGSTFSLQEALQSEEKARKQRPWQRQDWPFFSSSKGSKGSDGGSLYSTENHRGLQGSGPVVRAGWLPFSGSRQDILSPDRSVSLGYRSRVSSPETPGPNPAGVMSICADSSDEERSDREEEGEEGEGEEEEEEQEEEAVLRWRKARVTSVDEALLAVCGPPDPQRREDFLRQNFETLGDDSGVADPGGTPRLSMSSRFLALGHRNRAAPLSAKARDGEAPGAAAATAAGPSPQPPVSKVRPMLEGAGAGRETPGIEATSRGDAGAPEDPQRDPGPQRKMPPTGAHQWRPSNPALRVETSAGSHASRVVQNPVSNPPLSPAPSSDGRAQLHPPTQLLLPDLDSRRSPCPLSSPPAGSAPSSHSPLPWESPGPRAPRSYMSPTTSSMAKCSRASFSSLGEEFLTGSPPPSPPFGKRRRGSLDGEPFRGPPPHECASSLPPTSSWTPPPPGPSRPLTPAAPTAAVSPSWLPAPGGNAALPPSRIPLPRRALSPRHSLCLEPKTGSDGSAGLPASPASPASAGVPSSQALSLAAGRPEHFITLETCRQAVGELHSSLKRTATLYSLTLTGGCGGGGGGEDQDEMRRVLSEALGTVRAQLDTLPHRPPPSGGGTPGGPLGARGEGDRAALALLEQYSELLLKSVERRLDGKS